MKRIAIVVLMSLVFVAGPAPADDAKPGVPATETIRQVPKPEREAADLTPLPFDSVTTARYLQTARALAKAVATDDTVAFRALHTDFGWSQTDDWWRAMLATHKQKFGGVAQIVGPLRGVIRAGEIGVGVPHDGAAILLRFEKRMGASMSFTLDPNGMILRSSLWVQDFLADADTQGAEVLWDARQKGSKR